MKLFSVSLCAVIVVATSVRADVMSGNYDISSPSAAFNGDVNGIPENGTFNNGDMISHTATAVMGGTDVLDYGFDLTANVLTLFANSQVGLINSSLTWAFSALDLGAGPALDVVALSGVDATITPVGVNAFTITTSAGPPAGFTGPNEWTFQVVASSAAAVPEPATVLLLCLVVFFAYRRRQIVLSTLA